MNIFQGLPTQGGCWIGPSFGMGSMMSFWWVVPILILVGLYFAFYPRRLAYTNREDSMEIARRRYARGEISKDEFGDIQRNLK
jgi:putative membrane protein